MLKLERNSRVLGGTGVRVVVFMVLVEIDDLPNILKAERRLFDTLHVYHVDGEANPSKGNVGRMTNTLCLEFKSAWQ